MAGGLYIWIVGACFLITVGVIGAIVGLMWLGHLRHKKMTGSKAGFLEREPDPPHSQSDETK